MRNIALIGLVATGLSGCVVYEKDHRSDYDEGYNDYDADDEPLAEEEDEPEAVEAQLAFFPDQAEQGEFFIAYLTLVEGELDMSTIEGVNFYGDVNVLDFDVWQEEAIISLEVLKEAETGPVSLLIELGGNDVIWLDTAFTIYEVDSGNSAGDDEPSDGETSDGEDDTHDDDCPD